jgi:hypothetical protein
MIEGRVPPHAPGKLFSRIEAQGQSRDRRTKHITNNCHQAVCNRHRPEVRHGEDHGGPEGQQSKCQDDRASLGVGLVDRCADRRLDREAEQTADGRHQTDLGLAPVLLSDQEHVQVGPERAPDIGEQEIDGVERMRPKATFFRDGRHCHIQSVSITSVKMVSGAPTRK